MPVIKISKKDYPEIYKKYLDGFSVEELAEEYGVSKRAIYNIIKKMEENETVRNTLELDSATRKSVPKTENAIKKMVQKLLLKELTVDLGEKIAIGNIIVNRFRLQAAERGMSIVEYLEECSNFYETHKNYVDKLIEEKEYYKALAARAIYYLAQLLNRERRLDRLTSMLIDSALASRDKEKFKEIMQTIIKINLMGDGYGEGGETDKGG